MSMAKLHEIANVTAGQSAPQGSLFSEQGTPFVRAGSLEPLLRGMPENELELISEDVAFSHRLKIQPAGTIVFAKSGMSCMKGHVYVLKQPCYVVNHLACVLPKKKNSEYLSYYFKWNKPNQLIKDEAYPSISLADISNMTIVLHSEREQNRIVGTLIKVTNLIAERKQQLEKIDLLVKSQFIEMFGNNSKWPTKLLGDICELKAGKFISASEIKPDCTDGLYPCYGGNGLRGYVGTYSHDGRYPLIGRQGALCGNVQYVQGKFYATEHAVVTRPKSEIDTLWLSFQLKKKDLNKLATGAAQPGLTVGKLNRVEISLPPLPLQNRFADFVRAADKSKFAIQQGLKTLELQYNALLQEYFG